MTSSIESSAPTYVGQIDWRQFYFCCY